MSYYNQQQQPPPVGVPPPQGSFSLSVHLALYINWIWVSIFNFFSSIGYKPEGYGKEGYPPPGYPPPGYPPPGYLPQQGYPPPPYPAQGYPPPYAPQYAQPPPRQQNSTGPGCLEGWCVSLSLIWIAESDPIQLDSLFVCLKCRIVWVIIVTLVDKNVYIEIEKKIIFYYLRAFLFICLNWCSLAALCCCCLLDACFWDEMTNSKLFVLALDSMKFVSTSLSLSLSFAFPVS